MIHFYSRPCGRGDPISGTISVHVPLFLLTPLREGRHAALAALSRNVQISTHAPAGGATRDGVFLIAGRRVQISTHAPAGGATFAILVPKGTRVTISTHAPAGGATSSLPSPASPRRISTHAPAGGATRVVVIRSQLAHISTHAPAGGATIFPRLAEAGVENISTHAPAGGATSEPNYHVGDILTFLLTPLREGRR